jgi:ABC-type uncharacterized transport system fused permease/ATPase subunit
MRSPQPVAQVSASLAPGTRTRDGANPDQRIQEDARYLSELSADLGIGLLQSSLLLGIFSGVLWSLSGNLTFYLGSRSLAIPGYMVWCALIYTGTASWLSWLIGHPLVELNAARYAQEAELRFALVHVNEHIDSVSLYGGEEDEKRHLTGELKNVIRIMWQIVNANTRLTCITAGYGWTTLIAPILIAAPGYFGGNLSFGALMMAVGTIVQVQQLRAALAYPFPETAFKDDELVAALQSSGLNPLSSSLNEIARWENELVLEEQQCLVLTRLLLHKPGFLVTDETLDTLEEEARKLAIKLFEEELKNTVIINIGRPETRSQLLTRLLHLIKDPNRHSFKPDLSAAFSSPA